MEPFAIVNLLDLDDVVSARVRGTRRPLRPGAARLARPRREPLALRAGPARPPADTATASRKRPTSSSPVGEGPARRRGARAAPVGRRARRAARRARVRGRPRGHGHHRHRRAQAGDQRRRDARGRLAGLTAPAGSGGRPLRSSDRLGRRERGTGVPLRPMGNTILLARSTCRGITRGEQSHRRGRGPSSRGRCRMPAATTPKTYDCTICHAALKSQRDLDNHMCLRHDDCGEARLGAAITFRCITCGEAFERAQRPVRASAEARPRESRGVGQAAAPGPAGTSQASARLRPAGRRHAQRPPAPARRARLSRERCSPRAPRARRGSRTRARSRSP